MKERVANVAARFGYEVIFSLETVLHADIDGSIAIAIAAQLLRDVGPQVQAFVDLPFSAQLQFADIAAACFTPTPSSDAPVSLLL